MPELGEGQAIDVVRGRVDDELGEEILSFWSASGALEGEAARQRLAEVVCVLRDRDGEVIGVNSVFEEAVPLTGGRRFWIYRALISPDAADAETALFNAAFDQLDAEFVANGSGPIGVCVRVSAAEAGHRPEAYWPETHLLYAGLGPEGSQLRIRYFTEARIGPGMPNTPTNDEWDAADHSLGEGYRIVPMGETDVIGPDDVLAMWEREGAMPAPEAQRRVHEVLMVGLDPRDQVVAVATAFLMRNRQLGLDLWHYRTYVSNDHRMGNMAIQLLWASRDKLRDRYVSGEDTRGSGLIMEIENEFLKSYYVAGYWRLSEFWFIGESENGAHVRVHYFPGATVPAPRSA